jgi:hypothetical protein
MDNPTAVKLRQLAKDASLKEADWGATAVERRQNNMSAFSVGEADTNCTYWKGVKDGLLRSVNVVEGKG